MDDYIIAGLIGISVFLVSFVIAVDVYREIKK